jgi:ribonuclease Z
MMPRLPFRYIEPTFFAGQLDDPVLLVRVRPRGKNLLVDCGQIHHLAKRVLKGVEAIFISHAHMDHFMGIDTFIRHNHVSSRTFELYGPPGLAGRLAHKLAGYDWNLTEDYWCTFRVHEIHPGHTETWELAGPAGFPCRFSGRAARPERIIYQGDYLRVEAELCDHKIPTLAFRLTERESFAVDSEKLRRQGLLPGAWLRELKRRFCHGDLTAGPLTVLHSDGEGGREGEVADPAALFAAIRRPAAPASIGYLTDVGFTPENRQRVRALLQGVTLLVCECSYLAAEREKARASYHLCSSDVNELVRELQPGFLLPMHLSKNYVGRGAQLYDELEIPAGVTLLRLPEHLTPRPLLPAEVAHSMPA